MHIPDSILSGAVCPVTSALALGGISAVGYFAQKTVNKPAASRFAAVSAFIFAAQMLNFPVLSGVSGHFLGATLAVALLGPSFGILSMALVLGVQTLAFGDGGLSALGANVLNMALIASVPAILLGVHKPNRMPMLLPASLCSVLLATIACSAELAASGVANFSSVLIAMIVVHLPIAFVEAGLTAIGVVATAKRATPILVAAAFCAILMSPFASGLPDGLEATLAQFMHVAESAAYQTPFAGIIGIAMTFGFAMLLGSMLKKARA